MLPTLLAVVEKVVMPFEKPKSASCDREKKMQSSLVNSHKA